MIVDALEAAHDGGIVHRDLKRANIKITPNGVVKVLDFGLAKESGAREGGSSRLETAVGRGTESGIILGTAAYMSPEQARGQHVDARTDVWSTDARAPGSEQTGASAELSVQRNQPAVFVGWPRDRLGR